MSVPIGVVVAGSAAVCAVGGALVPRVLAALPEPEPRDEPVEADTTPPGAEPKTSYVELAAVARLGWWCALLAAMVGGLLGWRLGWSGALPMWLYLGVAGVLLGYVDWRTRLLPTRVIGPSYAVVGLLALVGSALTGDWGALLRSLGGWAGAGGLFFALWFVYPKGMGYGDVRLSGVLGIALGWLGWAELVTGVYAGFLLGAFGGGMLALLRIVDRKRYPFGPFMLVGALVGVLAGPAVGAWYLR